MVDLTLPEDFSVGEPLPAADVNLLIAALQTLGTAVSSLESGQLVIARDYEATEEAITSDGTWKRGGTVGPAFTITVGASGLVRVWYVAMLKAASAANKHILCGVDDAGGAGSPANKAQAFMYASTADKYYSVGGVFEDNYTPEADIDFEMMFLADSGAGLTIQERFMIAETN